MLFILFFRTDLLKYQIVQTGTNNTLQKFDSVDGLFVEPGLITDEKLSFFNSKYLPFSGYTREFV